LYFNKEELDSYPIEFPGIMLLFLE